MERLLTDPELKKIFGIRSDSSLWVWRKEGILPKPLKIRGQNRTPESKAEEAYERVLAGQV